ncbi:MAG: hypothetical protein IJO86_03210 [Oscillospiraceae bacterium]|nr:hypothetical protein [Oscillospiraceae bacterium]
MNGNKFLAVIFAIIVIALPILTAFSPKQSFSDAENRELASFPTISLKNPFSDPSVLVDNEILDKSFMNGFDSYVSDHFILRNSWVSLKSSLELLTMKRENNGILLTNKRRLVENIKEPNSRNVGQNILGINDFVKNNPDTKVFAAIAPTACDLYADTLPYGKKTWSQKEFLDGFYNDLGENVVCTDIYSTLSSKKDQYIYYNTDHHWTTLGAYYAYTQIASSLGFKPYDKELFDVEHASYEFYGTFSSKSNIKVEPDSIELYTLSNKDVNVTEVLVNNGKETTKHDGIYFREWLDKKDKYSVFLGQVQPEVTIKTDVKNNKKLLIFKDSFAHSLVPFLSLHYSEIKLIDLRYTNKNYRELADVSDYNDVLLLYNIDSIVNSNNIAALGD